MNEAASYTPESTQVAEWADARIAELMGVINAATAEVVSVTAKVVESCAWGGEGVRSPSHWLSWRAGLSPARSQSLVAMARRLEELPVVAAAFAQGRLSEDAVKLIVARTPPERDAEVADLARAMTVAQLARVLRSLPRIATPEPTAEPHPADDRGGEVAFGSDDDDRWWLRASGLAPERGALVATALEAARDAEFRTRHPEAAEGTRPRGVGWSDALERMARAALDALDPATGGGRGPSGRYSVLVHVRPGDTPSSNIHLGPALSAAARRRITCDADLRWVLEDEGRPVSWGRRRRSVDPVLRRLIEARDRGCRAPGCTQIRWLEVHHLTHVEDGGETTPENLACLCPRHHDRHHRGLLGIGGDPTRPDGLEFTDRGGRRIPSVPTPVPPGRPPPQAAQHLGIDAGTWQAPSGERFDAHWFDWRASTSTK